MHFPKHILWQERAIVTTFFSSYQAANAGRSRPNWAQGLQKPPNLVAKDRWRELP